MNGERASLERNVNRLAAERTALFSRSSNRMGLSPADQNRLRLIERELDESFTSLRRVRAALDVTRFAREDSVVRRAVRRHPGLTSRPDRAT
jgi:hypothetical protein